MNQDLALISSFTKGCNMHNHIPFIIGHPFQEGEHLYTEWLPSFHSSILISGSSSIQLSILTPSLFIFASISFLLYQITYTVSHSELSGILAPFIFFFIGGCGFVFYFQAGPRDVSEVDYIHYFDEGYETQWAGTLLHYLLASRSSQWSLSLVLVFLLCITEIIFNTKPGQNIQSLFILAGISVGLLNCCDSRLIVPTIIYFLIFLFLRFVIDHNISQSSAFFIAFATSLTPTLPFYVQRITHWTGSHFGITWRPLIERGIFFTPYAMWLENLGVFTILSLVLCWFFLDKNQIKFYIPSVVIFLISTRFCYQYDSYDNYFVLYPLWIVSAVIVVISGMTRAIKNTRDPMNKGMVAGWCIILIILCTASGVLGLLKQISSPVKIWDDETKQIGEFIKENTKYDAVFAIDDPTVFDPVTSYAGRVLYCSNNNLTRKFRIDSTKCSLRMEEFRNGSKPLPDVVDYYLTHDETEFQLVFQTSTLKLYKIK